MRKTGTPWGKTLYAYSTAGPLGCRFAGPWATACGKCVANCRATGLRVLFSVEQGQILVLHGFIKKSRKTPGADLALARKRKREFEL
jgi:Phage derived protein Gp49-like (DUF891)